jgi:Replicative DNA helicase
MFDNVNFWIDRAVILGGKPFDIAPYLSEVAEHQNGQGYSCTGKLKNYSIFIHESGVSLKGSLPKNYLGDNLHTLTRQDTKQAIEELSTSLHTDIGGAKVTRLDVSTVIQTKRQPSDYYPHLGNKPHFGRLQVHADTLQYNNHQRQIIFYDKIKEANAKGVQIPDVFKDSNLLRYELRYTKRLNKQLGVDLTAAKLYETDFYRSVIRSWYDEFKEIQKLKKQGFMTDDINTPKEAEAALFATLLQEKGQGYIDEYLAELKAKNTFKERQRYYELKRKLNTILQAPKGEQSGLIEELETAIFDIARYAR